MTNEPCVLRDAADLEPAFAPERLPPMAQPEGVLLCPPDAFDVVDVKNPFMEGQQGRVDRELARAQWTALGDAFRAEGLRVERIAATPGCEDMVFCANQTFTGLDGEGRPTCVLAHMRHPSRRREVAAFAEWFRERGYRVVDPVPPDALFEGGGDALWHPGRRLVWLGRGFRSSPGVDEVLARELSVAVASVELVDERFYHLDTCLAPIDERTALVYPRAFRPAGLALVRRLFPDAIEVDEDEAVGAMACNGAAVGGRTVVLDVRAERTTVELRARGYGVLPVDTGEFMKSGGSVFCMKQWLYPGGRSGPRPG